MDELFRELTGAVSIPGNEAEVRSILARELSRHGETHVTRWGDLWCERAGNTGRRPRVAIACHMDSPGFIVKEIRDDGGLCLIALGHLDPRKCNCQPVVLRTATGHLEGLVTHEGDDKAKPAEFDGFFGFTSADEARAHGVRKGDVAGWGTKTFATGPHVIAPNVDNRIGCWLVCRLAERLAGLKLPVDLFFLGTTCEESSLQRGAQVLAQTVRPDLALVYDVTYEERDVRMGSGPVLTLSDASVYFPLELRDRLLDLAAAANLPLQTEVYNYAGTDAGAFSKVGAGCLALPLLIATRNNHSSAEVFHRDDLASTLALSLELVRSAERLLA